VLVAAPAFLGELRAALPSAVRPYVMATVAKDIVRHADTDVRRYLTREMFNTPTGFSPAKRAAGG
jgi:protein required for attachment to host cells